MQTVDKKYTLATVDKKYLETLCQSNDYTSNKWLVCDILRESETKEDINRFYPYIYKSINCQECGADSGYRYKVWFGIFDFGSAYIYRHSFVCDKCLN